MISPIIEALSNEMDGKREVISYHFSCEELKTYSIQFIISVLSTMVEGDQELFSTLMRIISILNVDTRM